MQWEVLSGFSYLELGCLMLEGFIGTAHYVAPEVIRMEPCGKPVDIWSLGVLLYVLLGGQLPFCGTRERLFDSIVRGSYSVSRWWIAWIAAVNCEVAFCISHLLQSIGELCHLVAKLNSGSSRCIYTVSGKKVTPRQCAIEMPNLNVSW